MPVMADLERISDVQNNNRSMARDTRRGFSRSHLRDPHH